MSIASEITRLQTSKADIKAQVNVDKEWINENTDFITSEKLDEYDSKISDMQDAYKQYIPIHTKMIAKGNTTQIGTPTPTSPIEVKTVTGEQVVRVRGKNLLQHSAYDRSLNGITLKVNNDQSITLTGTATANTNFNIGTNADFTLGAGTYTFSKVATNVQVLIYYSRASVLANLPIGTQTKTFTLNNDTTYNNYRVVISIPNGTTVNETVYPMLEKNTTVTTYEPYQGKDYEINLGNIELNKIGNYQDFIRKGTGKNIFDNSVERKSAYVSNPNSTGQVVAYNNSSATYSFVNCCKVEQGKTYTISWKQSQTASSTNVRQGCVVDNDNIVRQSIGTWFNAISYNTFTANANGFLILCTDIYATNIQIEENSSATYYEPYGYKDKWYIEKNVGKVVLNGSGNWTKSGNTNIDRFVLSGYVDYGDTNCFSNYFDNGIYSDTNYTKNQIFLNTYSSTKRIIINYSTVGTTTLAQFKTWLQSNNIKVYYVLATPTYTLIDNEELLNQLEAVQLQTGENNVLVSGNLPMILDLSKYIQIAENHL